MNYSFLVLLIFSLSLTFAHTGQERIIEDFKFPGDKKLDADTFLDGGLRNGPGSE